MWRGKSLELKCSKCLTPGGEKPAAGYEPGLRRKMRDFERSLCRQRKDGRTCPRKKDKSLGIKCVKGLTPYGREMIKVR